MTWIKVVGDKIILKVWLQPKAAKIDIIGLHGDALKIKVTSSPEKGRANRELCHTLAGRLKVPLSSIHLSSGHTHRLKTIEIAGLSLKEVSKRLGIDSPG